MQHQVVPGLLKKLIATAAVATLGSVAAAEQLVPSIELNLDKPLYEAGDAAQIEVCGDPGDVPILLIGYAPGSTFMYGVGDLGLSLNPAPAFAILPPLDTEGKVTAPCAVDCPLTRFKLFLQVITIDPVWMAPTGLSDVEVLAVAGADCGVCPEAAEVLEPCVGGSDHAITLPGIGNDFMFVAGASFVERGDGTATLTGVVARKSDEDARFFVDVALSGRIDPLELNHPPVSSPKIELCDEAYVENGGPIRPELWHYYEDLQGQLIGMRNYQGAVVDLFRFGPAAQVGFGANGKNFDYGISSWLMVEVTSQPDHGKLEVTGKGDINIGLEGDCVDCPFPAEVDPYYMYSGGHALWLPGVGTDFVFEDGATFVEYDNGTAKLVGVAESLSDSDKRLDVELCYSERISPGAENHPPADSPKLELKSEAYSENGGPVDTSLWHYYAVLEGTVKGLDDLEGLELELSDRGPAFQVGIGASGKNVLFGASGWLDYVVVSQPDYGPEVSDGKGDVNIDLDECPEFDDEK